MTIGRRKIRCSGEKPCRFCVQGDAQCTFLSTYNRGLARRCLPQPSRGSEPDTNLPAVATSPAAGAPILQPQDTGRLSGLTPSTAQSSRAETSPHRKSPHLPHLSSNDGGNASLQGDYVGPASGVSFLLNAHAGLPSLPAPSSFSFSDLQLGSEYDGSGACLVLSRDDLRHLLVLYFDFTVPMDRFLHRPTVEAWCDEFRATSGIMEPGNNRVLRRALLQVVFALAQQHANTQPTYLDRQLRHVFRFPTAELSQRRHGLC